MREPYFRRLTITGQKAEQLFHRRKTVLEFEAGVNVLAGPNGSGKSTVLQLIFPGTKPIDSSAHLDGFKKRMLFKDKLLVRQFDFEMHNPRVVRSLGMMEMEDLSRWSQGQHLRRESHGEAMRTLLQNLIGNLDVKKCVILLDEPEQALDFPGLGTLRRLLKQAARYTQFIIASHSPVLLLEPSFHVVELEAGYVRGVRETLDHVLKGTFDVQDPRHPR